jgi:hypothetical protein
MGAVMRRASRERESQVTTESSLPLNRCSELGLFELRRFPAVRRWTHPLRRPFPLPRQLGHPGLAAHLAECGSGRNTFKRIDYTGST